MLMACGSLRPRSTRFVGPCSEVSQWHQEHGDGGVLRLKRSKSDPRRNVVRNHALLDAFRHPKVVFMRATRLGVSGFSACRLRLAQFWTSMAPKRIRNLGLEVPQA